MKSKFIREYFNFSTRERNGIIVLCIILLSLFCTKILISNQKNKSVYNFQQYENEIDSFLLNKQINTNETIELFYFNPNLATKEELIKLGLSKKAVNSICNFREKGGKFYKPDDLKKIYNMTDDEYERVKDYIIIENSYKNNKTYTNNKTQKTYFTKELSAFDPNISNYEELQKLGLNKQQINNIFKYRESGGKFYNSTDFKKIYGIDSVTFITLEPYITISNEYIQREKNITNTNSLFSIELNSADETDLQKLRGIGPAFSKRIIEYRNKLGGFISNEQLLEVYGFTNEMLENIRLDLIINEKEIKKININIAEYKDLISHPYIDKENALIILNYRKFAKEIKSFEELLKQKAISENFYNKLYPYLTTE